MLFHQFDCLFKKNYTETYYIIRCYSRREFNRRKQFICLSLLDPLLHFHGKQPLKHAEKKQHFGCIRNLKCVPFGLFKITWELQHCSSHGLSFQVLSTSTKLFIHSPLSLTAGGAHNRFFCLCICNHINLNKHPLSVYTENINQCTCLYCLDIKKLIINHKVMYWHALPPQFHSFLTYIEFLDAFAAFSAVSPSSRPSRHTQGPT